MPTLVEKATGKSYDILPGDVEDALASGLYDVPGGTRVGVVTNDRAGSVDVAELGPARQVQGIQPESPDAFRARENLARVGREQGGIVGGGLTALEQGVDSAFLNIPGAIARKFAPEYADRVADRELAHSGIALGANFAGAVLPAVVPGGQATLTGLASRGASRFAAKGAGKGLGARLGYAGAGAAGEGAVLGFGEGVQELVDAVDRGDELTLERVGSVLSSRMATGGLAGGALGVGAKAAETAIVRTGKALTSARPAASSLDNAIPEDVGRMTLPEVQAGQKVEQQAIDAAHATQKAEAGSQAQAYLADVKAKNLPLAMNEGGDARKFYKTLTTIRDGLDDPKWLQAHPESVLKPLRKQITYMERTLAQADSISKGLADVERRTARLLRDQIDNAAEGAADVTIKGKLVSRFGAYTDTKIPRAASKEGFSVPRAQAEEFYKAMVSGQVATAKKAALKELPAVLEHAKAWEARIDAAVASKGAVTPRMQSLLDQAELLKAGASAPKSLGERMTHAAGFAAGTAGAAAVGVPGVVAPVIGAWIAEKGTGLIFRRLGKATSEQAARTARAVDAFVDVSKKVTRLAPPLASKTLLSVAYAPKRAGADAVPSAAPKSKSLKATTLAAFKEREAEIKSQMDGPVVSRAARRQIAQNLAGVSQESVKIADAIETLAVRRLEFLASKLPRRPDAAAMQIGPDRWGPSMMQIRAFARYAAAVEDPGGVEERLAAGTVTPEDAEAYREVYPERYADFRRALIEKVGFLRETLPYRRRLALSIFSGVPVDPAMHPRVLSFLQSNYAEEPGSEGGTQAPTAQPQFASVSKQEPTAGQKRAIGE